MYFKFKLGKYSTHLAQLALDYNLCSLNIKCYCYSKYSSIQIIFYSCIIKKWDKLSSDVYCTELEFNHTIYNLIVIIYIKIILCKYKLIYSCTKKNRSPIKNNVGTYTEISYLCRVTCTVVPYTELKKSLSVKHLNVIWIIKYSLNFKVIRVSFNILKCSQLSIR